jgi:26S proteasome regulatory subunit N1
VATLCHGTTFFILLWLQVTDIMSNSKLSERYLSVARDLDAMDPKHPDDIYKMHLVDTNRAGLPNPTMDSAMKNLSGSVVNALLNVGFGTDKLVTVPKTDGEISWIQRNKDQGKVCAVASIGVCFQPDTLLVPNFCHQLL